ncbi:MAG: PilZ domain-containing protein [Nitrospiraceae bacterium]
MRLRVNMTKAHQGKALDLNTEDETLTLLGVQGEQLGTVSWEAIIDYVRSAKVVSQPDKSRAQPRVSLTAKVRYSTSDGKEFESRATGIGGGGLFIESNTPLPVGTALAIEFSLPDHSNDWIAVHGTVAWVCPRADQYTFFPGMGVQFTNISDEARQQVLTLIHSLKRVTQSG